MAKSDGIHHDGRDNGEEHDQYDNDDVDERGAEEDDEERRNRNRERNKEHARKTRVRKKEQLQRLKARVTELEEESNRLQQGIQECSVASILLGLSAGSSPGAAGAAEAESSDLPNSEDAAAASNSPPTSNFSATLASGKRKRFLSLDGEEPHPPPMELKIKGQITLVGGPSNEGKAQVNWKTGVYLDENGKRQQLTKTELEALRRERNRMHAKMTRDRKKCFIASLKRVISKLEEENEKLRETLERRSAITNTMNDEADNQPQQFSPGKAGVNLQNSLSSPSSTFTSQKSPPSSFPSSSFYAVG